MKEILPSLARGGGYFHRQGMKLVRNGREIKSSSVNWGKADIRNYDVYQPSGPGNALGLMKFTFPNKHSVYMHDTQSKGLFELDAAHVQPRLRAREEPAAPRRGAARHRQGLEAPRMSQQLLEGRS